MPVADDLMDDIGTVCNDNDVNEMLRVRVKACTYMYFTSVNHCQGLTVQDLLYRP